MIMSKIFFWLFYQFTLEFQAKYRRNNRLANNAVIPTALRPTDFRISDLFRNVRLYIVYK